MSMEIKSRMTVIVLAVVAAPAMPLHAQQADPAGEKPGEFHSGSWRDIGVDKQIIIQRLAEKKLVSVTCEGILNDGQSPRFLMVTEQGEYRWPINESGSVFLELQQLAIRRAGNGPVVFCRWEALEAPEVKRTTLQSDVLPGDEVLLAGFDQPREFSVTFQNSAGCAPLSAVIEVDGAKVTTADGVVQALTPDATFFGMGKTVEAKIAGLCGPGQLPILEFSIAAVEP